MNLLQFALPPLPFYISSGHETHGPGLVHVDRRNIGVFDLLAVRQGTLHIAEEDRRYALGAGEALILRPDAHHFGTSPCTETTEYYWMHFGHQGHWTATDERLPLYQSQRDTADSSASAAWKMTAPPFSVQVPQHSVLLQPEQAFEMLEQLTAITQSGHMGGALWRQQILFQELLQQLSAAIDARSTSPSAACATQAAAYLRQHYAEEISAREMADSLNFHSVYIARCMQKEFGCSPKEYLLRYRIGQAKLLLLRTDYPVARVAEEVGFNQAAYFASCFAKYEGISPRSYRLRFSHA